MGVLSVRTRDSWSGTYSVQRKECWSGSRNLAMLSATSKESTLEGSRTANKSVGRTEYLLTVQSASGMEPLMEVTKGFLMVRKWELRWAKGKEQHLAQ